jgi:hypothetical protein
MYTLPRPRQRSGRPYLATVMAAVVALLAGYLTMVVTANTANAADTLLSQGKTATASSTENAGTPASAAVDGNTGTRWSSAFSDPQWLQVDLGSTATIDSVTLNWEAAYATAFQIQTSTDATNWTTIYSTTTGTGGVQNLTVSGSGRYVRMNGTARATQYGYSLWEFQVYGPTGTTNPTCGTTNVAQGKTATATSTENAGTPASAAVDGSTTTRWSSAFSDPQSLTVDLGSVQTICQVVINWETAYASAFQIQTSTDNTNWTSIYSTTTGTGGVQTLAVSGSGRYIRMLGTARASQWGYSIWEFQVFVGGTTSTTTTTPVTTTTTPVTTTTTTGATIPTSDTPDFGSNVHIFDPTMSSATIQASLDAAFNAQKDTATAQFGTRRDAFLFKPGTYSNTANVGYYTSVAGLGLSPDDVTINGDVTVDAFNASDAGNATQNFWRSAENLSIVPASGTDRWAVAQAAPFRRIHVKGSLALYPASYGYASGGYIADTKVDGQVSSISQQQWYSRDSNFGSWNGGVWNMVFSGVTGAPAASFPSPPETVLATTPVSREKPFLYIDGSGKYRVFVPALRTNASGASWTSGTTAGTSLPMSQFYVTSPADPTSKINQALAQGLNIFFTPGIYHLSQTINVTRADTVMLGIGYPTLTPDNGVNAMSVADVNGVKLAGLLFDAGTVNSQALLTVGPTGSTADHTADPTTIQDVFFRIGGAVAGKATNSLIVNSNNAIIDHIWAWRADHGSGIGWTVNTADNGLTVNGNNVEATGLFVEHYQKTEVQWNGNGGKTIFFQNENPYDPPNQAAWMNGTTNGYPAYAVGPNVTTHEAWGMGSYCYFNVNPAVINDHAYQAPNVAGVKFHNIVTVSLGGVGNILHVINSTGAETPSNTTPSTVTSYP